MPRAFFRSVTTLALAILVLVGCKSSERSPAPSTASVEPERATMAAAIASDASPAPRADGTKPAPWTRPFLWRIEGAKPSYVVGTIHVPDDRLAALPAGLARALAASDAVATEIPMDASLQLKVAPLMFLPQGKTLQTVLPKPIYDRVVALFEEKGLPVAPFSNMKVWAVASQIVLLDRLLTLMSKQALDSVLYSTAKDAGKEVLGLETVEEQIAVFDSFTSTEQARMLEQTMDQLAEHKKKGKDLIEELLVAYLSGDEAKLHVIMTDSFDPAKPLDVKLRKRMFLDRNANMAERIAAKLTASPGRGYLFAVGAGHLVGDGSVVALLASRGMKLTRVTE